MINLHKFEDDELDFYDLNNVQKLPHWISHHDNQVIKRLQLLKNILHPSQICTKIIIFLPKVWLVRTS